MEFLRTLVSARNLKATPQTKEKQNKQLSLSHGFIIFDCYLETGEQCLGKGVKGAAFGLRLVEVELATEQLHAQQGEDDEEEEEQQQQRGDGLHGVQQRCHQVGQGCPVPSQAWVKFHR